MDSILNSIKKLIGVEPEEKDFDEDIITHINSVFMVLNQMGVGPEEPLTIFDELSLWNEFSEDSIIVNLTKTYMYLKVKLLFDPPLSSSTMSSMERLISEFEWRLNSEGDYRDVAVQ